MKLRFAIAVFLAAALGGCAALDRYDRTYSVVVTDGKESIAAGVTLHPRDK